MPATKKKPTARSRRAAMEPATNGTIGDVMTLAETAAYLRLAETEVVRLVREQDLPGRLAGADWRFLKSALQLWLSQPVKKNNEGIWAFAGAWKDDPHAEEILKEIYARRGRPMTEE